MKLLEYGSTNYSTSVDLTSSGANQQLAQEFTLKNAAPVGQVALYLQKTGSPAGYLQVEIQYDSAGVPSGEALASGVSNGLPMSEVSTIGWVYFAFDEDSRPELAANTTYHVVLKASSGYTYTSGTTEITWGCDQSSPHYVNGQGETYDGAAWTSISTDTDFCFQLFSRTRLADVYASIGQVAGMARHLTNAGKFDYSPDKSKLSPTTIYDFIDDVSDEIDLWLSGAGFSVPITSAAIQRYLRRFANCGVAMQAELTQRTVGFRGDRGADTHIGAWRMMYEGLRDGLKEGNEIVNALQALGLDRTDTGEFGKGLTAGGIVKDERDVYADDTDLAQWTFQRDMWTNT